MFMLKSPLRHGVGMSDDIVHVVIGTWYSLALILYDKLTSDRQLVEWANAVRSTLEPVIHTHLYPRSQVDIVLYVEQQDGGVLPAMINACTLALMDAGIPMSDYVTCLLYTSPSPRDVEESRMPSSA